MSFFAVTIERISNILPHPNADRLMLGQLEGVDFQFVIAKDKWNAGDSCLYFPLDAVLPDELLTTLNLTGKLAGAKKNRVKTVKLRGEISQGLIASLDLIAQLSIKERTPERITEYLGVTKYEAEIEIPTARDARLIELPDGVGIYDIENSERYPKALAELMEQPVVITEKLEGSHFALAWVIDKAYVCQRRFALENIEDKPIHFFWEAVYEQGLLEVLTEIRDQTKSDHIILRGEIIGPKIQSNIYRLEKRIVKFFDVQVNGRFVDSPRLRAMFESLKRPELLVPVLSSGKTLKDWLGSRRLKDAASGQSALYNTLREGIIIKPEVEQFNSCLGGRLILKQICPEYLASQ